MDSTIEVLNGSGHLSMKWDPADPEEVARARAEALHLYEAGYSFFLVDDTPADPIAAGRGELVVRRMEADDVVPQLAEAESEGKPKRAKRAVAIQRMAGG